LLASFSFVPLKKIALSAVVTIGGAFLPDLPKTKSQKESGGVDVNVPGKEKVSFKGAPDTLSCSWEYSSYCRRSVTAR
jgi:hypothetical protein